MGATNDRPKLYWSVGVGGQQASLASCVPGSLAQQTQMQTHEFPWPKPQS